MPASSLIMYVLKLVRRDVKACSNGPNNVGPTLFNKLETLDSTACFSNVLIIL